MQYLILFMPYKGVRRVNLRYRFGLPCLHFFFDRDRALLPSKKVEKDYVWVNNDY